VKGWFIHLNLSDLISTVSLVNYYAYADYSHVTSYIRPHFVRWSKVRTTYDDDIDEVSDNDSEVSDDDFVGRNTEEIIDDDDMVVTVEDLDFNPDLNKMSITPKSSLKYGMRMPARIRPSTSPESL